MRKAKVVGFHRMPKVANARPNADMKGVYSPEREGAHLDAALARLEGDREAYEAYCVLMRKGVGPIAYSMLYGMMMGPCTATPHHPPSCACYGHGTTPRPEMMEPAPLSDTGGQADG